jgi:molybdopterin converting factor small subunit
MKQLRVRWFAVLREEAGCAEVKVETTAGTAAALYEELRQRHRFSLPADRLKVAVNGELGAWEASLPDGAEVVFIPPFAGG